jgi:N-methylhydantoinase A
MTEAYEIRYGAGTIPKTPVEVVTLRVEGVVPADRTALFTVPAADRTAPAASSGRRSIYLRAFGEIDAQVYDGDSLRPGSHLEGPAIIDRRDTTILIPPGYAAWVDGLMNTRLQADGDR